MQQLTLFAPNSLQADPLDDTARQRRRKNMARLLCAKASNPASWAIADRLAQAWDLGGCAGLGCPAPPDLAGDAQRRRVVVAR